MTEPMLAVIGGSGLYEIDGLTNPRWHKVTTPWVIRRIPS
jgi:5'-methylthioadenosine phosphorylase